MLYEFDGSERGVLTFSPEERRYLADTIDAFDENRQLARSITAKLRQFALAELLSRRL